MPRLVRSMGAFDRASMGAFDYGQLIRLRLETVDLRRMERYRRSWKELKLSCEEIRRCREEIRRRREETRLRREERSLRREETRNTFLPHWPMREKILSWLDAVGVLFKSCRDDEVRVRSDDRTSTQMRPGRSVKRHLKSQLGISRADSTSGETLGSGSMEWQKLNWQLPESIGLLGSFEELPESIGGSLGSFKKLPESIGGSLGSFKQLPESTLEHFDISYCSILKQIAIGNLGSIQHLNVPFCSPLKQICMGRLESIEHLNPSWCLAVNKGPVKPSETASDVKTPAWTPDEIRDHNEKLMNSLAPLFTEHVKSALLPVLGPVAAALQEERKHQEAVLELEEKQLAIKMRLNRRGVGRSQRRRRASSSHRVRPRTRQ